MYSQTFFVTSVRASVDLPQIAASSVLSFFGAKMPLPAFFRANETFLALAFCAVLPRRRFSAVIFFNAAFVIVVFFVVVVATVVFVVVVIAMGRMRVQTRLEPKWPQWSSWSSS